MSPAAPTRGALFDIDGTLVETGGASDRAWHRAFLELHDADVDVAAVTGRGVPDPEVGRTAFAATFGRDPEPAELAALMDRRLSHLEEEVRSSPGYRVLPGVVDLLEALSAEGVALGVTTGNVEPAAHIKLRRGDLDRFFTFGGFGSDSPDRAELTRIGLARGIAAAGGALAASDFVSAGDTPRDVAAGHAAGLRVVGVATGAYSADELLAAGADWAVASFEADLPAELAPAGTPA